MDINLQKVFLQVPNLKKIFSGMEFTEHLIDKHDTFCNMRELSEE